MSFPFRSLAATLIGVLLVLAPGRAAAQTAFEGAWRGVLDVGAAELRLELVISVDADAASGVLISVDQGGVEIPLNTLVLDGDAIRFAANPPGISYDGALDDGRIVGEFAQGGARFPLDFERGRFESADAGEARPFEPNAEPVRFAAGPSELAGVLRRPDGEGPFAAVVILSGSGPQDRDGTIAGQRVYAALAEGLSNAGIASLRLDDRGVGESTGPRPQAPADLAGDAAAALTYLRGKDAVYCAGFAGHSEGAILALLAAPEADPDFIISLAGMHLSLEETLLGQSEAIIRASGGTQAQADATRALQEAAFAVLRNAGSIEDLPGALERALIEAGAPREVASRQAAVWGQPYVAASFQIDPGAAAAAYDGPMLAIFAENDTQVLAEPNADALAAARPGADTEIHTAPGVDHVFQVSETGAPSAYGSAGHAMAPAALELIGSETSDLVRRTCGAPAGSAAP